MRILLLAGGVLCVLAGVGFAQVPAPTKALPPAEASPPTPKAFVGVWAPTSCVYDGVEQLGDAKVRDALRLSVENGEYKLYFLTDPVELIGKRVSAAKLTADEKAGTFGLTITDGQGKGKEVHGIYKIDGETMKLCYGPVDQARPTKFEAPKGAVVFNEEWSRVKLKKEK